MGNQKVNFSSLHFIVDDESPQLEDLKILFSGNEETISSETKDTYYLVSKEIVDDKYFWASVKHGNTQPYTKEVLNTKNEELEKNPKKAYQIEPKSQFFILYSFDEKILYLSNTKKKGVLEEYCCKKLKKSVYIKNFYKSVDEFIAQLQSVEKVKFVGKRSLFSRDSKMMQIFPEPKDLYGLGEPEAFVLEAYFNHASVTEKFIRKFKTLKKWTDECQADELVCIGKDDSNIENIFNVSSFIKKVSVYAEKNKNGILNPEDIKLKLLQELGYEKES